MPNTNQKVNIASFRRDVAAFADGSRKHPDALKGIKDALNLRSAIALQKRTSAFEQQIEDLEKKLADKKEEEQEFARATLLTLKRSKQLARLYLEKSQSEDFFAERSKKKKAKSRKGKK